MSGVDGRKLFVITGISGAGKSQALKAFEDFGWFCVDNLPVALVERFAEFFVRSPHRRVALGMDIREGRQIAALPRVLKALKARGVDHKVLYLDARDAVVIQRFSETRHRHPLGGNLGEAIKEERRRLLPLKEIADTVIDTTSLTLGELKETISETLALSGTKEMTLSIVSFGYKHGIPIDADIVMDVRFLPNPHYVKALRHMTGLDAPVQRFILRQPPARKFLNDWLRLIRSLLPHYVREGKSYLTIAVGCTGGRHRSVFITRWLAQRLRELGYPSREFHRDAPPS